MVHASTYRSCASGLCSLTNSVWRLCGYRRGANISEAFTPIVPGNIGHNGDGAHYPSLPGSSGDTTIAEHTQVETGTTLAVRGF